MNDTRRDRINASPEPGALAAVCAWFNACGGVDRILRRRRLNSWKLGLLTHRRHWIRPTQPSKSPSRQEWEALHRRSWGSPGP